MKRIICGKRYDTNTAKKLADREYLHKGDPFYCFESLYQKKTGEYFLYGKGGSESRYAIQTEMNSWSGGEKIAPLTYKEAQEWTKKYLTAEKYESIFGVVTKLDTTGISLKLPAAAVDLLKKEAAKTGKQQSAIVSDLIINAFTK